MKIISTILMLWYFVKSQCSGQIAEQSAYPQILDFQNITVVITYGNSVLGVPKSQNIDSQPNVNLEGYSLRTPQDPSNPDLVFGSGNDIFTERPKRGVVHLYNMISCVAGCDPLMYKGYGCYCGFLGSGKAVDGIDRCCQMHDRCYDRVNCPMYLEYFVPYLWKCYYTIPLCARDHGKYGGPGSCASRLCKCDQAFAECLRRFPCPSRRRVCRSSPLRYLQNMLMTVT